MLRYRYKAYSGQLTVLRPIGARPISAVLIGIRPIMAVLIGTRPIAAALVGNRLVAVLK